MRNRLFWLLLLLGCPACGGSSSGGGDPAGPPPPPPAPFATTINTGLAVMPAFDNLAAVGSSMLVPVSERDMSQDRNGDGDTIDQVVAAVDTEFNSTINLGFAVIGPVLASDRTFAFRVSEGAQGFADLNGDGDFTDSVWFVYDPNRPIDVDNPINTGVAASAGGLPGIATEGGYVLLESEGAQGRDLNGDGDLFDVVVAVFQESVRSVVPVATATWATASRLVARHGRVLVLSSEFASATDLNRDGDAFDTVLHYVDFSLSTAVLNPIGGFFPRAVVPDGYGLTDDAAVYMIDEASEGGFDLNGDGDATDAIIAVEDIGGGSGEHLPFSPQVPAFGLAVTPGLQIGTSATRAVVGVDEAAQGGTDLNGDLDAFDSVLGWIDTLNAPTALNLQPFALSQNRILAAGTRALVTASELDSGAILGVDLNGDGDTDDSVAFMLDMALPGGALTNLGLATTTLALNGNDALIGVPEAGQFNGDLNGNGIVGDVVSVYFNFGDTPPTMRSLGIVSTASSFFRLATIGVRLAAVLPEGQSSNFDDLNGDGDTKDVGIVLLGLDPDSSPPPLLAPTPFFAGTAGFVSAPPLRVGDDAFAFASAEDMLKTDLNGDGDTLDTVLHFVRYEPIKP